MKKFNTLDVLGAATGVLMREISGIYEVLTYAAGEDVYTHQIPRVSKEFGAQLKHLRPDLAQAFEEAKTVTRENYGIVGASWIARYGAMLPVAKMSEGEHERIDPISELAEMISPDKIIAVACGRSE